MPGHDASPSSYPTAFGRGWIPGGRNLGIPGEASPPPVDGRGPGGGGCPLARRELDSPHPNPSPETQSSVAQREGLSSAPPAHNAFTPTRKAAFLGALAEQGNVRLACARVRISAQAAYVARRRDALFAQAWAAALVLAREHAEQVLASRALDGVDEPVFYHGAVVAVRRRFDGRLLLAHLARLDARAGDPRAEAYAARFDELLALIAGEHYAPALADQCDEEAEAAPDPWLPMPRARFLEEAAAAPERDHAAERWAMAGDGDALGEEELAADEDEEEAAEIDPWLAEAARARDAAGAQWDGWFARACAVVDRLGECREGLVECGGAELSGRDDGQVAQDAAPPVEFKSRWILPAWRVSPVSTAPPTPSVASFRHAAGTDGPEPGNHSACRAFDFARRGRFGSPDRRGVLL